MSVINLWAGAVSQSGFVVKAKVEGSSARLLVSEQPDLSSPAYFGPATPTAQGIATLTATGLEAKRQYYYAVEDDSVLDTDKVGKLRTFPVPGEPSNGLFLAASCADGRYDANLGTDISQSAIFLKMMAHDADLFIHTGDMHYRDINTNNVDLYRDAYDDVLASPNQQAFFKSLAMDYVWDDHDFGPNNSWSGSPGTPAAQQAYRERFPHYPLNDAAAIDRDYMYGRLQIAVSDLRSERDDPTATDDASKRMMSDAQMNRLFALLQADPVAFMWGCSSPWMAQSVAIEPANVDCWAEYTYQRDALAAEFLAYQQRGGILFGVGGDLHTLAIDDGSNNAWGGFPIFQFAAMDGQMNYRGGPYSHGRSAGKDRYGSIRMVDDGNSISFTGTGYIRDTPWRSHTFGKVARRRYVKAPGGLVLAP